MSFHIYLREGRQIEGYEKLQFDFGCDIPNSTVFRSVNTVRTGIWPYLFCTGSAYSLDIR